MPLTPKFVLDARERIEEEFNYWMAKVGEKGVVRERDRVAAAAILTATSIEEQDK